MADPPDPLRGPRASPAPPLYRRHGLAWDPVSAGVCPGRGGVGCALYQPGLWRCGCGWGLSGPRRCGFRLGLARAAAARPW